MPHVAATNKHALGMVLDNTPSDAPTGYAGEIHMPWNGMLKGVTMTGDVPGDAKLDLWKCAPASYPPDDADSICGGNEPELVNSVYYHDGELTGWTKTCLAGEIIRFNVDSCSGIKRLSLILEVEESG